MSRFASRATLPLAIVLALALGACRERAPADATTRAAATPASADQTPEQQAEARVEADRKMREAVAAADRQMDAERARAQMTVTPEEYKTMLADGQAQYDKEVKACAAGPEFERASCREQAEAEFDLVKAEVQIDPGPAQTGGKPPH